MNPVRVIIATFRAAAQRLGDARRLYRELELELERHRPPR